MQILSALDFTLPLTDPVLKYLLILLVILGAPLLLNKIRVPPLLGLIIAGAVIGPHGFNLILRDSGITLSGTAGLLYIMFLAGLEIDMGDFKRNSLVVSILARTFNIDIGGAHFSVVYVSQFIIYSLCQLSPIICYRDLRLVIGFTVIHCFSNGYLAICNGSCLSRRRLFFQIHEIHVGPPAYPIHRTIR